MITFFVSHGNNGLVFFWLQSVVAWFAYHQGRQTEIMKYGSISKVTGDSWRVRSKTPIPPSQNFRTPPHLHLLSAIYLIDWEAGQAPSIDLDSVTPKITRMFMFRYRVWRPILNVGILLLILSSVFEHEDGWSVYLMDTIGTTIVLIDFLIVHSYSTRLKKLPWSMVLTAGFLSLHLVELTFELLALRQIFTTHKIIVTSIMKPVVFFYAHPISSYMASSTFCKILPTTIFIFTLELFFILCFSILAETAFSSDSHFGNGVGESFITLFALSTSVNNPACWMELYNDSRVNAAFFVAFLILTRFYVHSVVLGVILHHYTLTLKFMMDAQEGERTLALKLSFIALARGNNRIKVIPENMLYINRKDFKHVLAVVRNHYKGEKLDKLWSIVEGSGNFGEEGNKDASRVYLKTYLSNIPVAMGVRVRRKKHHSTAANIWGGIRGSALCKSQAIDFWKVSWICIRSLGGPMIMIATAFHVFCYIGMFAWFGQVGPWLKDVGSELYYLNSFNSYLEGLVTLFNLLAVNDWHQIALLYTNEKVGSRWNYLYFIIFNIFVSELLVSIIVGYFVTGFINEFGKQQKKLERMEGLNESLNTDTSFEDAESEGELEALMITERRGGWNLTKTVIAGEDWK